MSHATKADQGPNSTRAKKANVLLHNNERLSSSRGLALLAADRDDQTHAER